MKADITINHQQENIAPTIEFTNVTANWCNNTSSSGREDIALTDVSLQVGSDQLLTVVGKIGAGKVKNGTLFLKESQFALQSLFNICRVRCLMLSLASCQF